MKPDRTAIIVDDTGAAFVGWFSGCAFSPSGAESYYSIARFAKPRLVEVGPNDLRPFGLGSAPSYVINNPKVFSSARAARRALERIRRYHFRELAIVD